MSAQQDQATPIEGHDALPLDRVRPWLERALGRPIGEIEVGRYGRGWSNLTFALRVDGEELVLRRPPPGVQIAGAHDMAREARVLQGVAASWGRVPAVVAVCEDPGVLGAGFYVMRRVPGVILRDRLPPGFVGDEGTMARVSRGLVDAFVELHGVDLAPLAGVGRPDGYVRRQVEGWTRRWVGARTDDVPDVERLAGALAASMPEEIAPTLLHNDYKYDNVVLDAADPAEVRAVLDWEMAAVGDPRMDLGTLLAWWVEAGDPPVLQALRMGPTHLAGSLTRAEIVDRYAAGRGLMGLDARWFHAFGLFKNAVVAQQLYARYKRGLTDEPRYARMLDGVRGLAAGALAVLGG